MITETFVIIAPKAPGLCGSWTGKLWFTVKLIPILPSFTAEMPARGHADVQLHHYHVIKDIGSDAEWLDINLGLFSKVANYTDLKELNISGLAALESLSPDQKAELLLDPSTGAIENVTVVKEVLSSILKSRDEEQLEKFFETFVEVSKENITYITNAGVRDAILNLTLTALAPKFPLFQTSDYELWFQINLVVLLASFRPSVLVVLPANLTCDSYDAVLKGLENALAVLPSGIGVELKSSIGELRQSAPEGTVWPDQGSSNCDGLGSQVPSSDRLCDFGISEYACSSVASSLSSGDLVTLLTCKQPNSTTGAEAWKLFFQKVTGVLEVALSAYSSTNLSDRQPEPHVLDAIGEVKVNNFSATQLTDVSFVAHWVQGRLRPFLPAASKDFLSCLSSKNFSCDTYQVVVQALSRQASLMEVGQQRLVFADFVLLYLSRDDLADPACLAKTTSSADWLEKNFGNFSVYATLEQLQTLNANFSSFESLTLLSPSQVAELTLSSGALNSTNQIDAVFDRLEDGDAFKNVEEFLTTLTAKPEASQ
ncbi:putative threonine-rich GPI-anchored glyco isoform X2 [Labeo rohita]|uniref:Putative threonine-rich GPI-anchored glyco isoform X2 n=1 Tax=Labeo rohita TaxID=84645 RepID=A0A498NJJ0_LABRO|nr:putative threonine-rich GPI-anchored glyco isoform X2 [Labeo rohita]